jgi:predicted permease
MENLLLDLRYAIRVLRKSPAFTVVALLTLMLGIGANVVVLGVLNAVLLQSLDVRDPAGLYQLRYKQWMMGRLITTSYPAFEDFRRRNDTFTAMAAINAYSQVELRWRNAKRNVAGDEVSSDYFNLLGVHPQLGRFFNTAEEHGPNSMPYVVLSDALWRSTFQADSSIIGSTVQINEHPFTVVGVASARFHGTERFVWPDYWIPIINRQQVYGVDTLHDRAHVSVTVLGRLKPGITAGQATENLNAIANQLAREYPTTDDGQLLRLIHPGLIGDEGDVIRGFLRGVTILALLVLSAACANLATLFASRVADRARELAIRMALGSSRQRLSRQLLTEAFVLSLAGGAVGLVTAKFLLAVLNRWQPAAQVHLAASVDTGVFLEGLALTLASALMFGIVPAWHAWHSSPLQAINSGAGDGTQLRRFALRNLLLGLQIAICTFLLTASLVAVRGMEHALHVPLGFQPRGAMLAEIDLGAIEGGETVEKKHAVLDAVQTIPGVTAIGTISRTPFTGGMHGIPIFRPGTTEFKLNNSALAPYVFTISPGYMEAARIRLLAGKEVSWHDTERSLHVAVVNQTFARKMWSEATAIGQHFIVSGNLTEVVGIAQDGKYHDLQESPQPVVYLPLSQNEDGDCVFVVRSRRTPSEMVAALEGMLSALAPNVSVTVRSWSDSVDDQLFPARVATTALGVMGLLAAMLAITGIFGMAAYGVSRRMKELGIRAALGARRAQVTSAALKRPLILLGVGAAAGLLSCIFSSRLLGRIVYQANPRDPLVLIGVLLLMTLISIVATIIPARKALSIDPSELMRQE